MKKKILSIVLFGIICVSLVACSGNNSSENQKVQENAETKESIVVDNKNYKITIVDREFKKEFEEQDKGWPTMTMIIENKTDLDLDFEFKNVSINGFMADVHHNPMNGVSTLPVIVNGGKKAKFDLTMLIDTLENTDDIRDLEADLVVSEILEMSQYYNMALEKKSFEEISVKAE